MLLYQSKGISLKLFFIVRNIHTALDYCMCTYFIGILILTRFNGEAKALLYVCTTYEKKISIYLSISNTERALNHEYIK